MYRYDSIDTTLVNERVEQYRDQTERYLAGEISESEFLPLRLQNGLYVQRLAPMLRIAIPYGMLSAKQLHRLADISCDFDKGYAHFTTRQNVQLNWPKLNEVPNILAKLAEVEMHAIQTSGNCIRNTTTDQFAGVASDELEDPRPYCELIRQWSTFHPEFAYLPRKFKIALCASSEDRAAVHVHDIGLLLKHNERGETGFQVLVGGGLGRTPVIGSTVCEFLPRRHLIAYLDSILHVYNQLGRRDNKYKARIKILVRAMGVEAFREKVEAKFSQLKDGPMTVPDTEFERMKSFFTEPDYQRLDALDADAQLSKQRESNLAFDRWCQRSVTAHKQAGYAAVTLSLKPTGIAPGDATDKQMHAAADLAEQYSFAELRVSHEQNLILSDVRKDQLQELWLKARKFGLATPNINLLTDMICCPGGDFCALANAKSIPVAESIQRRFDDMDYLFDIGQIDLNISGCMNACGHHHVGHIGILGVDKKGSEFYQIQLGGSASKDASLGKVLGPSFSQDEVPDVIEKIIQIYVANRTEEELFIDTYRRIGLDPFKEQVYAA
ncbi:MAG: nitrite/sulfite reductase [Pseudomonadales bacterium]